jgi:hypothetical protein
MTRLIRVETCDQCPHAVGSRGCREALYFDDDHILRIRLFDDRYPEIPGWCPLEEGLTPLLVFRRSHEDAFAVLRWKDLLALVQWSNRDGDCRWRNLAEAITGERV